MEWFFFIIKPSFISALNTTHPIEIFLSTSFILVILGVIAVLPIWGASRLLNKRFYVTVFIWIGAGMLNVSSNFKEIFQERYHIRLAVELHESERYCS
jgi:hypothetical protein